MIEKKNKRDGWKLNKKDEWKLLSVFHDYDDTLDGWTPSPRMEWTDIHSNLRITDSINTIIVW